MTDGNEGPGIALRRSLLSHLHVSTSTVPQAAASIAFRCRNDAWAGVIPENAKSTDSPVGVESRFLIQSLTKSFTALIVLRLVAAGKLALDTPLSRWLPDIPNATRITIRQCLQHTSGFPDYGPLPEYHDAVRRGERPWTFSEFLEHTHAGNLLFEPGTGWYYSNIGYMIVRRLIENVNNQSFSDTITEEICRPLGLRHTSVVRDQSDLLSLTAGHSTYMTGGCFPVDVRGSYDPDWIATGVIASTASDVVSFYHQLLTGTWLPSEWLHEMRSVVRAATSHPRLVTPSYGLGLMADPDSPYGAMYGHSGAGPGYTASAFHVRSPRREPLTVAVLSNTENIEAVEMMALAIIQALAEG